MDTEQELPRYRSVLAWKSKYDGAADFGMLDWLQAHGKAAQFVPGGLAGLRYCCRRPRAAAADLLLLTAQTGPVRDEFPSLRGGEQPRSNRISSASP